MDDPVETSLQVEREQHTALGWAAGAAVVLILWLVEPIGVGIMLGAFLAFMVQPLFERLKQRLGTRSAALASVLGTAIALAAALGGLGWLLVDKGTTLATRLIDAFQPGGMADGALDALGRLTQRFGVSPEELGNRARALASDAAVLATKVAEQVASTTGSALLGLFFAMLSMHYILCNWQLVSKRAQETFPLRPEYTAALFAEFRKVGRTTLLGALGTGVAQGVLATLGYAIAGVPEPVFFGAATAIASFVPAVGVLLVIVPVTIGLFLVHQPGHAILELVWSMVLVVGVCDYVVRPRLVRGESKVPTLVTFVALFGGIEVFGLKGLILGPVLMSLALAVLRLYASEARARRRTQRVA